MYDVYGAASIWEYNVSCCIWHLRTLMSSNKPTQIQSFSIYLMLLTHLLFIHAQGAILGDDMGMGKTVQIAALLAAIYSKTGWCLNVVWYDSVRFMRVVMVFYLIGMYQFV